MHCVLCCWFDTVYVTMSKSREKESLLKADKKVPSNSSIHMLSSYGSEEANVSMSQSDFDTLSAELSRHKSEHEHRLRSRSLSDVKLMDDESFKAENFTGTMLDINDDLEKQGRHTLYGTLPFVAAFGMQNKERSMKKVISAVSLQSLLAAEFNEQVNSIQRQQTKFLIMITSTRLRIPLTTWQKWMWTRYGKSVLYLSD